jgi:hypothetical protein
MAIQYLHGPDTGPFFNTFTSGLGSVTPPKHVMRRQVWANRPPCWAKTIYFVRGRLVALTGLVGVVAGVGLDRVIS